MDDFLPIFISIVALFFSAFSFTLALFSYLRDKSTVRAWSYIVWHRNGPETETPILHIRVANIGRRPVSILNLAMRSGSARWSSTLNLPKVEKSDDAGAHELFNELHEKSFAHVAAIKLLEGEVFEKVFRPEDCPTFIGTHIDPIVEADELYVEDILGDLYRVKGGRKHLKQLFAAWNY